MPCRLRRPQRSHRTTRPRSAAPTASRLPPGSTAAARHCERLVWWSWLVPEGVPVTDRGQPAPLLLRGTGVEPVAAVLEIADDPLTVFERIVVVVLELRFHAQHCQPYASDAGKHPPVRGLTDRYGRIPALGLEVGQLGGEDLDLALGVVDNRWAAYELHRGVVTGRHAVLIGSTRL